METPYYIENLIKETIRKEKARYKGSKSKFDRLVKEKMPDVITRISIGVMEEIYRYCIGEDNDTKKWEEDVRNKINSKYGVGIKLFEAFIELNSKISSVTYNKYYHVFNTNDDQIKLDTLIANHVRACQVANEIKVLVANGYSDGAHARWRTLHEICVTFLFLYDSDYETIEMYNSYGAIESWKKGKEYMQNYERLGFDPMDETELQYLELTRQNLIDKFGKEYGESYGWTLKKLPKGRRNIREMERLVDKDYLRAVYAWASENVHAGVSSIKQKIGLREEEQYKFLPGPNDYGFLDPVQYASYSLTEMSSVLLGMEDSLMNSIMEELLNFFQNEVVKEFEKSDSNG